MSLMEPQTNQSYMRVRVCYRGPSVSENEAVLIADQYVREKGLSVGGRLSVMHRRPIILGRPDDKLAGSWDVFYKSLASPPLLTVVINPDPSAPVIIQVNDQTGEATVWGRL